jgi:predicted alpha/beta-fold hydrolase
MKSRTVLPDVARRGQRPFGQTCQPGAHVEHAASIPQSRRAMKRRMDVAFISGQQGDHCQACLYEPEGSGPFPTIVMAHGLGGIKEMRLDAFAERFSLAGYACLVFDYRHFGASDGLPRHLLDIGC